MERFQIWLEGFSDAWRTGDQDAVADLFAPGARYHESPFAEPLEGRDAIRGYWAQGARHSRRDVEFRAEKLAADSKGGIAHWAAEFTSEPGEHRVRLDGILMATVNADGRCTEFREWWHRIEDHDER